MLQILKAKLMPQRCCMHCMLHLFWAKLKQIHFYSLCMYFRPGCDAFVWAFVMQGNRVFPRDRFREKILGNRWFCDLSLWVLNLDLGNTNLFRHKNLYKFYTQIERESERCKHVITPTELLGPRRCWNVAWFAPALEAREPLHILHHWIHGTSSVVFF